MQKLISASKSAENSMSGVFILGKSESGIISCGGVSQGFDFFSKLCKNYFLLAKVLKIGSLGFSASGNPNPELFLAQGLARGSTFFSKFCKNYFLHAKVLKICSLGF